MRAPRLLALTIFLIAFPAGAAGLREAEFTRVINDVRVLPTPQQPLAAKIGDKISGLTAVSTGVASRAELQFPDKTLTRIGSNSVFRLNKADRTFDLERGVILLSVPKQIGGAKVRTAAVTAAVTGTTVMIEYAPDGAIKIIVLEGEVDVFLNNKPEVMRTLTAGDLLVLRPDADSIPLAVKVDLDLLRKTSKLMDVAEFGPLGNAKHLADALTEQGRLKQDGELLKTAFEIMGRGTQVTLTNEARQEILRTLVLQDRAVAGGARSGTTAPVGGISGDLPAAEGAAPRPAQDAESPPGSTATRPILNAGTTIFGAGSSITTNPHATAFNSNTGGVVTMQGTIYQPGRDGPVNGYLFNSAQASPAIDRFLADRGDWFAFNGERVVIAGNIAVNTTAGPRNLLIASQSDLNLTASPGISGVGSDTYWELPGNVDTLVFAANGSIIQDASFSLSGAGIDQSLAYHAFGPASDVLLTGAIGSGTGGTVGSSASGDSTTLISAGRDAVLTNLSSAAGTLAMEAGRDVSVNNSVLTAQRRIDIKATGSINITDSSLLRALTALPSNAEVVLAAINGSVNLTGAYIEGDRATVTSARGDINIIGSGIFTDVIKAQVLSTGGQLIISGGSYLGNPSAPASLVRLYGDGASGVRFSGDNRIYSLSTDIAGKSVTIDSGGVVRLSHPAGTRVFTDQPNFNNGSHGNFTDLSGTQTSVTTNGYSHASKPAF